MTNEDRLAELIIDIYKQSIKSPSTHIRLAEVISISPVKLTWGDIILEHDKLVIPQIYKEGYDIPNSYRYMNTSGSLIEETRDIKLKIELKIGDKVTIAPDEHWKQWFIIDKVGE